MNIKETSAGKFLGQEATLFTLQNDAGDEVDILDFGLTLLSWRIKFPEKWHDVLLGYENLQAYTHNAANFGCIVGRFANRIAFGQFTLNNKTYQLPCNLDQHHLHGGPEGFGRKPWKLVSKSITPEEAALTFQYHSMDGEQGYPGNMDVTVTIRFSQDNSLSFIHEATSDTDTPVNLTNHAYFNLGNEPSVLDHELEINADFFTEVNQDLIPTGKLAAVEGTPYDFNKPVKLAWSERDTLGKLIPTNGYDVNYVTRDFQESTIREVAKVYNKSTDLSLIVSSNKPGLQLYTGNWLQGIQGKNGKVYQAHAGFCLESQDFPDAPNHRNFPSAILKTGQKYFHTIVYTIKKGEVFPPPLP